MLPENLARFLGRCDDRDFSTYSFLWQSYSQMICMNLGSLALKKKSRAITEKGAELHRSHCSCIPVL